MKVSDMLLYLFCLQLNLIKSKSFSFNEIQGN